MKCMKFYVLQSLSVTIVTVKVLNLTSPAAIQKRILVNGPSRGQYKYQEWLYKK
jgi:hypothetical protein